MFREIDFRQMAGVLFLVGAVFVFVGLVLCTDRVERHHKAKASAVISAKSERLVPPFRTSEDQCRKCGNDDGPLSIDTGMCFWCFEKATQG